MKPGAKLKYRSTAGDVWDAVYLGPHGDTGLSRISIPFSDKPGDAMEIGVTMMKRATKTRGCCWPARRDR